jgi:hypothetical protein
MIPVEDILEALDLSRAEPGSGFLEALFARFNARVPFENASKIVRNAEIADAREKPRTPEIFWNDHLEHGTGGTCFARVAAFDALLSALSFRTRRLIGRVQRDGDHAALMIQTPAGESIADVGFPLPALLPARAGHVETALGGLEIEATARGFAISWKDGVPEGPRCLEVFSAPVEEEQFADLWGQSFSPAAHFLQKVSIRRDLGNRIVSYAGGEIRVDDLHSRLRVPLPALAEGPLSELFGIDRELLSRAFEVSGREASEAVNATLTAYLEVASTPDVAFGAIATREGYGRLVEGMAEIASSETTASGFRVTLSAPGRAAEPEAAILEEISPEPAARRIAVERSTGQSRLRSAYRAEQREGRTYLIREATLLGAREDLLRNDSLRGRLAGALAVDLLAWARMLGN